MSRGPDIPRLLRPREIAEALGVSRAHAYRLLAAGAIPAIRVGPRAVRALERDVLDFIERQRGGGGR